MIIDTISGGDLFEFREECFYSNARFTKNQLSRDTLYPCFWCGTSGYHDGDCGSTSCNCPDVKCNKCEGSGELSKEDFCEAYAWWREEKRRRYEERERKDRAEYNRLRAKFGD